MCSFIEVGKTQDRGVQRAAATSHRSASRNLTRVNIQAGGGGSAAREHQVQNEAVCVGGDAGGGSSIVADGVCDLSETVSKPSPSTHS